MRTKYALLAIILIQTLCASVVGARGSAIVGRASLMDGTTFPCTLDVVLVTFANATSSLDSTDDYHLHDRPYGTNSGEQLTDRYTRRDFERLFSGGYDGLPDFVGTNQTVGAGHRLPEVFGSVRAYYDSVSNGVFQLHVRMINPVNGDYPRWVELPETKEHYAEISLRDRSMRTDDRARAMNDWFWDDAEAAAWDSVQSWNANITDYSIADLPNDTYDTARRLRHKVVYLYSGSTYDNNGLLHPQADGVTQTNVATGIPTFVSYRYVMGERQGFGDTEHGVDEFAGIGMHAHEIGHLLGLNHGGGNWTDPNRYGAERRRDRYGNTAAPNNVVTGGANQLGWTLMQGGGDQGPIMDEGYTHNGYYIAYRSCPNPINPFYLRDLGWLTPTEVRGPQNDYRIASGTTHRIDRGAVEFLLNRRTLQPFGGRYVSFYDYAAHIDEDDPRQGLMIWRRAFRSEFPLLIVADERRYRDSRDQDRQPIPADHIPEYHDMLSDPFAAGDINDPRTDNTEFDQDNVSAVTGLNTGAGLRQATSGVNRDPTSLNLALTNIAYDSTTDTITVDIYMARPSPPTNVTAVVSNGQMTLDWEAPSDPGPPPNYRYRQSTDGTWGRPIDVAETEVPIGRLVPSTAYAFEVWSVNPLGSSDRVSISPLMLEGPTAIAFPEVVAPEAGRRTVANYTATDPEDYVIEWSLAGTDADDFALSPNGQLTFRIDPDFEEPPARNHPPDREPPTDQGENNSYHLTIQARAGQQSATLDVTVTVTDVDEPGVIVLSSRSPQVRVPLTATLTDPDGVIAGVRWQWQGQAPGTTTWQTLLAASGTVQSRYTPQAAQVGWMLRAVVTAYRDTFGAGKRAESMATVPVAGVPSAPLNLVAAAGDKSVTLTWEAPTSHGGAAITGYAYRYRPDGGTRWLPSAAGRTVKETTFYVQRTLDGLTNGRPYTFEVWAVNAVGAGASAFQRATPQAAGPMSVSFGSDSYRAFEGGDPALVMVQLSPSPSRSVSIPVMVLADEGTEPGDYTVAGLNAGKVVFAAGESASSFTIMANEDADRDDETVRLSFETSGVASAPPEATVTLLDNDEADGTVALSSLSPQEGAQLTAELTDPSGGITGTRWQWQRQSGPTSWTNVAGVSSQPRPEVSIYRPQAGDVGYPLRATVGYTDANGPNQRAESAATAPVRASLLVNRPPSAPAGPDTVWVAENTTAIESYTSTDPDGDALGWTVSPSDTFAIRGGVLSFQNAPDYESGITVYTATLKTYDGALWSPSKTVTVRVTDVDEEVLDPIPLAVRDLASRSTGRTSGQASWKPPGNAHAAKVHSYRYRLDSGTIQTTTTTSASFSSLQPGSRYSVDVWAVGTSGAGSTTTTTFTTDSGVAPVLAPVGPLPCYVNEYCSFTFPVATRGTEPITYKVSPPSWATASGRSFSGTAPSSPGTASASLNASNAYGTDSESLTIKVEKRVYPPVLASVSSITCYVGEYCSFTFPVATRGTKPITYKVSPPSWATASGRSFSGTAPNSPGTASASLNASNAYGTDSESLTINIEKRVYPPVLASVSSITCYVGEYCSFTFPAATSGTAPITYKVSPPSWATASGRSFSGTAPSSPGTASASLNASNAYGTDSESLTINIEKRVYPPVLASVSSITCYVGEYCSFTFPAATSGTKPITYKVSPPSWATASGRSFSGTAPSSPGTFSASLNASNAYGTDSESLTINVKKRLAIAPGAPSAPSAAAGFVIDAMAGRIGMPTRRPKNPS